MDKKTADGLWRARFKIPPKCKECGKDYADPPSDLCPGCEAYKEHTEC